MALNLFIHLIKKIWMWIQVLQPTINLCNIKILHFNLQAKKKTSISLFGRCKRSLWYITFTAKKLISCSALRSFPFVIFIECCFNFKKKGTISFIQGHTVVNLSFRLPIAWQFWKLLRDCYKLRSQENKPWKLNIALP